MYLSKQEKKRDFVKALTMKATLSGPIGRKDFDQGRSSLNESKGMGKGSGGFPVFKIEGKDVRNSDKLFYDFIGGSCKAGAACRLSHDVEKALSVSAEWRDKVERVKK